jgi:hypothetical protein
VSLKLPRGTGALDASPEFSASMPVLHTSAHLMLFLGGAALIIILAVGIYWVSRIQRRAREDGRKSA